MLNFSKAHESMTKARRKSSGKKKTENEKVHVNTTYLNGVSQHIPRLHTSHHKSTYVKGAISNFSSDKIESSHLENLCEFVDVFNATPRRMPPYAGLYSIHGACRYSLSLYRNLITHCFAHNSSMFMGFSVPPGWNDTGT